MEQNYKEVKNKLEALFDNAKTIQEEINIKFEINDYLDEGYNVWEFVYRYNSLHQK